MSWAALKTGQGIPKDGPQQMSHLILVHGLERCHSFLDEVKHMAVTFVTCLQALPNSIIMSSLMRARAICLQHQTSAMSHWDMHDGGSLVLVARKWARAVIVASSASSSKALLLALHLLPRPC